jgi:Mrp family chromosome partitioning ATPase
MRELLRHLGAQFDYILIDSPPIIPISDAVALATMVDGVLMVVGTDTPKQAVSEACSRLHYVGANFLGVVLNRVDINSPDYRYYNGYSYHYHDYYQRVNNADSKLSRFGFGGRKYE